MFNNDGRGILIFYIIIISSTDGIFKFVVSERRDTPAATATAKHYLFKRQYPFLI
jgi:hypothetical protein